MKKSSKLTRGRVTPGTGGVDPRDALERLRQKLHPSRLRLSGMMRALVDYVTGERFTAPWIAEISITSDGFVVVKPEGESGLLHDEFFGTADDLYRNYEGVLRTVEVDPEETFEFCRLYNRRVMNYSDTLLLPYIQDLVLGRAPVDPVVTKLKKRITVLRDERGRTSAEAATAQRFADEFEQAVKKRESVRANRTTLILCKSCGEKCGQDAQGVRYGTTHSDGSPLYPGFCSQACRVRGHRS